MGLMDLIAFWKEDDQEQDYLKADKPVPNQSYALISLMKDSQNRVVGLKVRKFLSSDEEYTREALDLRDQDENFDVYKVPIGLWTPIADNVAISDLNEIAKTKSINNQS